MMLPLNSYYCSTVTTIDQPKAFHNCVYPCFPLLQELGRQNAPYSRLATAGVDRGIQHFI
jgi:hypothetical protein